MAIVQRRALRPFVASLFLLAVALVGCTGGAPGGSGQEATATGPTGAGPVTLRLVMSGYTPREPLDAVRDAFEAANPGVSLEFDFADPAVVLPDGTLNRQAQGADMALISGGTLSTMVAQGALRDLSALELPPLQLAVAPVVEAAVTRDGHRYGVPYRLAPVMLRVEPQALAAAGLEDQPVDWDLEQFQTLLGSTEKVSISALTLREPVIRSFGGRLRDPETGAMMLDQPETVAALNWLRGRVQAGVLLAEPEAGVAGADVGSYFWNGQPGPSGQWLPYPGGPRGRAAPAGVSVLTILSESPQPEWAGRFLTFMLSPEGQLALAQAGVYPLAGEGDDLEVALAAWRNTLDARTAEAVELSLAAGYVTRTPLDDAHREALARYFQGEMTLDELQAAAP